MSDKPETGQQEPDAETYTGETPEHGQFCQTLRAKLTAAEARISELEKEHAEHLALHKTADAHDCAELEELAAYWRSLSRTLVEALREISEPDQEPLLKAAATGDHLRVIQAVTHALNWCRDRAEAALQQAKDAGVA